MEFGVIQPDGTCLQLITPGNVDWDERTTLPASALTAEQRAAYGVVPLYETSAPVYASDAVMVYRDGCEYAQGRWQYKWSAALVQVPAL